MSRTDAQNGLDMSLSFWFVIFGFIPTYINNELYQAYACNTESDLCLRFVACCGHRINNNTLWLWYEFFSLEKRSMS